MRCLGSVNLIPFCRLCVAVSPTLLLLAEQMSQYGVVGSVYDCWGNSAVYGKVQNMGTAEEELVRVMSCLTSRLSHDECNVFLLLEESLEADAVVTDVRSD